MVLSICFIFAVIFVPFAVCAINTLSYIQLSLGLCVATFWGKAARSAYDTYFILVHDCHF